MSKIVCDVCGSSYSDTEAQCPICGTAKSDAVKPVVETTMEEHAGSGRHSKTNNRSGAPANRQAERGRASDKRKQEASSSNMAMIIIVAVLLIAIVAVCVFIAVRVMDDPSDNPVDNTSTSSSGTQLKVPCTGIELLDNENKSLSFTKLTESAQLTVKAQPENTTDKVTCTYTSSDPSVVQVDKKGLVTPKATGEATITITYKTFEIKVDVTCNIPGTGPALKLAYSDVTWRPGDPAINLYNGKLDPAEITWTSSDETVATVKNGVVTGLKDGTVTISATYAGGEPVTCKVHISGITASNTAEYAIRNQWNTNAKPTIKKGETLEIYLYNIKTGEAITEGVTWKFYDASGKEFADYCTATKTAKGYKLTGKEQAGKNVAFLIEATYQGQTYKFQVIINGVA